MMREEEKKEMKCWVFKCQNLGGLKPPEQSSSKIQIFHSELGKKIKDPLRMVFSFLVDY